MKKTIIIGIIFAILIQITIHTISYISNNYSVVKNDSVSVTDRYIDCVNLGNCEDLSEEIATTPVIDLNDEPKQVIKQITKGNSKLGELTTHKGVYVNSAILDAIDAKFNKADAKKLKVIMLAECAKDYKIDGVATYECKSTTQGKNSNGTYDCGYLQINSKKPCTQKDFAINYQVEMAYKKLNDLDGEICGKWKCWSSYKFKDSKTITTSYNMWANK